MTLEIKVTTRRKEPQFPIMLKVMTDDEIKEYHLKKFTEWGKKSEKERNSEIVFGVDGNIYRDGMLLEEEPSYEQKGWAIDKMKAPECTWQRWFVGLYLTEEQKKELGITDEDIAGRGMR